MSKLKIKALPVEVSYLRQTTFSFVSDETIAVNAAICLQHVLFIISLDEKYLLPGPIRYSFFKTAIVYSGSIVELLLFYHLSQLEIQGKIPPSYVPEYEELKNKIHIYQITPTEIIYAGTVKKTKKILKKFDFHDLNKLCKRMRILTQELFEKAERIRTLRNTIHLANFSPETHALTKKQVNACNRSLVKILERIKKYYP